MVAPQQNSFISATGDDAKSDKIILASLSEKEKHWYDKFQNGLLIFDGWKQISQDILSTIPPEEQTYTRGLLDRLGIKIGSEWSKENSVRKIHTDHLQDWGGRLRSACDQSPESLLAEVESIAREVDSILAADEQSLAEIQ